MPFDTIVFGLVFLAGCYVVGRAAYRWFSSENQKQRREMRTVPRRLIRDVRDGDLVRVTGIAEVVTPLVAPVSCRDCVYWHVVVREPRRRDGPGVVILDEHASVDFMLGDSSGSALVEAKDARVAVDMDFKATTGLMSDTPDTLLELLRDRGHITETAFLDGVERSFEYAEGVFGVGEAVTVIGVGRCQDDPDPNADGPAGFRERPKRLVIVSPEGGQVLMTDQLVEHLIT